MFAHGFLLTVSGVGMPPPPGEGWLVLGGLVLALGGLAALSVHMWFSENWKRENGTGPDDGPGDTEPTVDHDHDQVGS